LTQALSDDDDDDGDDSEVETEKVPPPMKFARPRAGAGPALKATFRPQPLFVPSLSPEPNLLKKAVSGRL
jgi:hypothetical protein